MLAFLGMLAIGIENTRLFLIDFFFGEFGFDMTDFGQFLLVALYNIAPLVDVGDENCCEIAILFDCCVYLQKKITYFDFRIY